MASTLSSLSSLSSLAWLGVLSLSSCSSSCRAASCSRTACNSAGGPTLLRRSGRPWQGPPAVRIKREPGARSLLAEVAGPPLSSLPAQVAGWRQGGTALARQGPDSGPEGGGGAHSWHGEGKFRDARPGWAAQPSPLHSVHCTASGWALRLAETPGDDAGGSATPSASARASGRGRAAQLLG